MMKPELKEVKDSEVKTSPAGTPLVLFVTQHENRSADDSEMENIRQKLKTEWARIWDGKPPCPVFVLPPGMDCYF